MARHNLVGELLDMGATTTEISTILSELEIQREFDGDLSLYAWRRSNALLVDPTALRLGGFWLATFNSFQRLTGYAEAD